MTGAAAAAAGGALLTPIEGVRSAGPGRALRADGPGRTPDARP